MVELRPLMLQHERDKKDLCLPMVDGSEGCLFVHQRKLGKNQQKLYEEKSDKIVSKDARKVVSLVIITLLTFWA